MATATRMEVRDATPETIARYLRPRGPPQPQHHPPARDALDKFVPQAPPKIFDASGGKQNKIDSASVWPDAPPPQQPRRRASAGAVALSLQRAPSGSGAGGSRAQPSSARDAPRPTVAPTRAPPQPATSRPAAPVAQFGPPNGVLQPRNPPTGGAPPPAMKVAPTGGIFRAPAPLARPAAGAGTKAGGGLNFAPGAYAFESSFAKRFAAPAPAASAVAGHRVAPGGMGAFGRLPPSYNGGR